MTRSFRDPHSKKRTKPWKSAHTNKSAVRGKTNLKDHFPAFAWGFASENPKKRGPKV